MSRVPHTNVARSSRRIQKKPFRLTAALLFGLLALLGLATFGVSAQFGPTPAQTDAAKGKASSQSSAAQVSTKVEFVPGDILVRYRDNAQARREELAATPLFKNGREMPLKVERFEGSDLVPGLRRVRVQPEDTLDAIAALKTDPDVLYAEPNYIMHREALPNDPRFGEMWGLKNTGQGFNGQAGGTAGADIDAEQAWNITTGSSSVVVGIIDTGIDINHPDLVDNIWVNPGEVANNGVDDDGNGKVDDVNGWDFTGCNQTPGPTSGPGCGDNQVFDSNQDDHGTHVAGTIGAKGNNGIGVTGINWNVKLMSLKFLGGTDGTGATSNAIRAFSYAKAMRDRGINLRVLNCSWGSQGGPSQALFDAISSVGQSGILVTAAAGNDGVSSDDFPHYPSSFLAPNLISVGRTNHFDNVSASSNFGPRTVQVGAPGFSILSTTPNNTYSFFSGTSMSTPHVSGVAALILAANPSISVQRLRSALIFSGEAVPGVLDKFNTARRLNAHLALLNAAEADTTPPTISGLSIAAQNGRNVTLQFSTGDDGTGGPAPALFSLIFTSVSASQYYLASLIPSASGQQKVSVNVPVKNTEGWITLTVVDNAGNVTSDNIRVTVSASGSEPYTVSLSPASPLSTGGTALALIADDEYRFDYPLPFNFPFFGKTMTTVTISTNGALYFSPPPIRDNGSADDLPSSTTGLNRQNMIAGMWDDLRTDRFGGDVFVVTPDANRIIFRWQGSLFANDTQPINFEIELRRDGTVQTRYGAGNVGVESVVGISGGEADAFSGVPDNDYLVSSHTAPTNSSINLTNAQTVTFAPQTAPACTYSISPTAQNFTASGGTNTVNVTAGAGCAWAATSNDTPFITITSGANGTGNGTVSYSVAANATSSQRSGTMTIAGQTFTVTQDGQPAPTAPSVQFSQSGYTVSEAQGFVNVVVTRTGDTSSAFTVKYATSDTTDVNFRCDPNSLGQPTGIASRKCDYHIAAGKLRFASGETTKQLALSIVDDVFVEGNETFTLTLSSPAGATLGQNISVPVTITDNDFVPALSNPIDQTGFYVRQLYVDLLSREPDPAGLAGWTDRINLCGQPGQAPGPCDRVTVGGDGFLRSGEFFDRQFFVLRLYRTGLGRILRYEEVADLAYVSGFLTAEQLELNKQDLVAEIMSRQEFRNRYDALTDPLTYVTTLEQTAGVTVSNEGQLISELANGAKTRAQVFREISESAQVSSRYLQEAQVVSAYYGFFTRNPDAAYQVFLDRLQRGEITLADLAFAFINAQEYRQRFGP